MKGRRREGREGSGVEWREGEGMGWEGTGGEGFLPDKPTTSFDPCFFLSIILWFMISH